MEANNPEVFAVKFSRFDTTDLLDLFMGPMVPFQTENIIRPEHVTCICTYLGSNTDTVCGRIDVGVRACA